MIKKYKIKLLYKDELIEEETINIIKNDNNISFIHKDVKNIINNNTYTRENNEYKFLIDIDNKKSVYLLKEKNVEYDIKVFDSYIEKKDDKITIFYHIESNDKPIKIILERCD